MLTPEYLLRISEGGEAVAEELHISIIQKIVDRIMLRLDREDGYILTPLDKWQIQVLKDAGFLLEDIQKEIAKATNLMQEEIAEAMEDAGVKAIEHDNSVYEAAGLHPAPLEMSPHMIRIMQRSFEETVNEWVNFTRTMAENAQLAFIKACDNAYNQVISGSLGYAEALKDAINQICDEGVEVVYPTGHTDSIETATLRCIRTGVAQASGQITYARMEEMDWDIILTSAHIGARPGDGGPNGTNHIWWQGRFFSKSGKDKRFPPFKESTGYGTITGLCGVNCRHSFGPGDGVFNPYDTKEFNYADQYKEYKLQQRQRTLERRIRKTKRDVMGKREALDKAQTEDARIKLEAEYQRKALLLQKQNKEYNDFCEANGLKKLKERITIAKWDRSEAAKARGAAKKYQKNIENSAGSGTMKAEGGNLVKKAIESGEVSKTVNAEKQNRHIKGSKGYITGRSYINGNLEDTQNMVNQLSGTGVPVMAKDKWQKKERVSSETVIGVHVDPKTQEETETRHALIVYSKTGSHIIPRKGE